MPWALLSGGDSFESFREQLLVACEAGASGFLVGRALWNEYVVAPAEQRDRLLESVVRPRFAELTEVAESAGADWASRYDLPTFDELAYAKY